MLWTHHQGAEGGLASHTITIYYYIVIIIVTHRGSEPELLPRHVPRVRSL